MLYHLFRLHLAALALTMMTLAASCVGIRSSASIASVDAASAETLDVETTVAEAAEADASEAETSQREILASATERPRKLNAAELGWVERNWPEPNPKILIDHSFWLTLRDLGEVAFVTTQSTTEPKAHKKKLAHSLMLPNGKVTHTLPFNETTASWRLWKMKAVAFTELDFSGSEPDAIVIAEYLTGIGPTGSQPFPATTVYFNQGDHFTTDPALNRLLTRRGVATIAEAEAILRDELQFLP